MTRRIGITMGLIAASAFAVAFTSLHVQSEQPATQRTLAGTNTAAKAAPADDHAAILKTARDFEAAFAKRDAKSIAALWTLNGEARDASGRTFTGQAAIQKAYEESFNTAPNLKIEVLVKSVRFPASDMAVEEGLLRVSRGPKDLPSTSSYVAIHAREGGQWKIALSSEHASGYGRLEDLEWLLGEWTTKVKDEAVKFTFVRNPKKPFVTGTFTRTPPGKEPITGDIRIASDPESGQIRSWGFDDDGAHSQSLWVCDGKSWILDTRGVLADGTPTAERIIVMRVDPDTITWRAVDRVLGDEALPDIPPMRLTRVAAGKPTPEVRTP
jgi:uncharacterized protein (TIGR02246 family)